MRGSQPHQKLTGVAGHPASARQVRRQALRDLLPPGRYGLPAEWQGGKMECIDDGHAAAHTRQCKKTSIQATCLRRVDALL